MAVDDVALALIKLHEESIREAVRSGDFSALGALTDEERRLIANAAMDEPEPLVEQELRASLRLAEAVLQRHECEAVPRAFDPVSLPALLITDADSERRRDTERISEDSDPLWAELLGQLTSSSSTLST